MRPSIPLLGLLAFIPLTGCEQLRKNHGEHHEKQLTAVATTTVTLVCGGQSNMVGTKQELPFDQDGLVTPVNMLRQGPCYAAAVELAHQFPIKRVVAVNCAVGGSSINRWTPGADLYSACVQMVKANKDGPIMGLLFYQGEADVWDTSGLWPTKFISSMRGLQQDLALGDTPVVFAQVGAWCDLYDACATPEARTGWADFQTLQEAGQTTGISMIRTKDLPTIDGIHHSRASYQEIGHRFALRLVADTE